MRPRALPTLLLAGLLALLPVGAPASMQPQRPGHKWALVVASGAGSRERVQALVQLLRDRFGFAPERTKVLADADATSERIQQAMAEIQGRLEPYDALFVHLPLELREDPSAGFSFVPSGAGESWNWIPVRRLFEWLSNLPVGSALVVYPACPSRLEDQLVGDLAYGKRPGAIELMRVCEASNVKRAAPDPRASEQWRARLTEKLTEVLGSRESLPLSAPEVGILLERHLDDADVVVRRLPEYIREGFLFEPVANTVEGEIARFESARDRAARESALRNLPGIVKAAANPAREEMRAVGFLKDVALSPTARVQTTDETEPLALRSVAVEMLGALQTALAQFALGDVTKEALDSPWLRRAALTQLTRYSPPRQVDLFAIRARLVDPDASVREAAVRSIVVLNDTDAMLDLNARLVLEKESSVRVALLQAVTALGRKDRAPVIDLLDDPDPAVRAQAAVTLARLGPDAGATAALIERLRKDESDFVRQAAASALSSTWSGDPAGARPVTSALLVALRDGSSGLRAAAAYSLGRVGGPGAEETLRTVLRGGTEESERIAAAEALGQLKSAAAVPDLVAALNDEKRPSLRPAAAAALGEIGTPDATSALAKVLGDRDPYVQSYARRGLESVPVAPDRLVQSLKHEQASVRLAAVRRVAASKDPQAVLALVDLLGDPALEVREAAAAELSNHDDDALIRQLDKSARTGRGVQQSSALSVLGRIPGGKATETLIRFVREANDLPTRVEGLSALGQQAQRLRSRPDGSPTDAALLKDALTVGERASRDDSPQARRAAVAVLGAAPAGRMRLEEMAKADPSEDVRTAAIEQLRYRSAVKSR